MLYTDTIRESFGKSSTPDAIVLLHYKKNSIKTIRMLIHSKASLRRSHIVEYFNSQIQIRVDLLKLLASCA